MLSIAPTLNAFAGPLNVPARAAVKMAVEAPITKVAGDYGFDPLGLGTPETFVAFREAELKHGRLAMLAAVAWPLQEIFHPILVDSLRASGFGVRDALMETAGKSPSLLNGGLGNVNGVYWAAVVGLAVYWEGQGLDKKFGKDADYLPGMLNFDPLGADSPSMRNAEITNGRVAMLAITFYAFEEALTKAPIFPISLFK